MWAKNILIVVLAVCMASCSGGSGGGIMPPPPSVTVSVSGGSTPLNIGAARIFTAQVTGTSSNAVTWSVVENGGGTINQTRVYTAPALPGTYTVEAVAQANTSASGKAAVPVIIPEGSIPGYSVGVDYHAYNTDFLHTAFITIYNQSSVRQTVRASCKPSPIAARLYFNPHMVRD